MTPHRSNVFRSWRVVGSATLLLLLLLYLVPRLRGAPDCTRGKTSTAETQGAPPELRGEAQSPLPRHENAGQLEVRGLVRERASHVPIQGAVIRRSDDDRRSALTDASGRFSLRTHVRHDVDVLELGISADGFEDARVGVRRPSDRASIELGDIWLANRRESVGRVTTPTGEPASGAVVRLIETSEDNRVQLWEGTTARDGTYRLNWPAGWVPGPGRVAMLAEGRDAGVGALLDVPPIPRLEDIVLLEEDAALRFVPDRWPEQPAPASIDVHVLRWPEDDARGHPGLAFQRYTVRVTREGGEDGVVLRVPSGTYRVFGRAPPLHWIGRQMVKVGSDEVSVFRVSPILTAERTECRLRALTRDGGRPIPGADVHVRDPNGGTLGSAMTDDAGWATLSYETGNALFPQLHIDHPDFVPLSQPAPTPPELEATQGIIERHLVRRPRHEVVRLLVTDHLGRRAPEARAWFVDADGTVLGQPTTAASAFPDATHVLAVSSQALVFDAVVIRTDKSGEAGIDRRSLLESRGAPLPLEVGLVQPTTLPVVVTDSQGQPLPGVQLRVWSRGFANALASRAGELAASAVTTTHGRAVLFVPQERAQVVLRATHPDHGTLVQVLVPRSDELTLQLPDNDLSVAGRALRPDGAGAPATVQLSALGLPPGLSAVFVVSTTCEADGNFVLRRVPAGLTWRLRAHMLPPSPDERALFAEVESLVVNRPLTLEIDLEAR